MKRLVILAYLLSAQAALACTPAEVKTSSIYRGEACALGYSSPSLGVGAGQATRLNAHTVQQFITVGSCSGEQIVAYYDCDRKRGYWLGGTYGLMGGFAPPPANPSDEVFYLWDGPADYFVREIMPRLGPDLDIDRIATKAATLPWITQQGALSQSRITVEGKAFDLSCGCRLPAAP